MDIKKKILIIDDDPDILEALQLTFEAAEYDTKTIINGEQAYKAVQEYQPSIIILDVLLSGSDGRIICKNLKSDIETKHIPVLMISAQLGAAKSTMEVGANDFLAKPFNVHELLKKVENLFI